MDTSIIHITSRGEACHQWFCDAIVNQSKGDMPEMIFVDAVLWSKGDARREELNKIINGRFKYRHIPPKPSVFQGPNRLTTQDYFAASNARNTGLCYVSTPYAIFADDLSCPQVGWLDNVAHAARNGYVFFGAYRKVKNLVVEDGKTISWEPVMEGDKDIGLDCRWGSGSDQGIVKAPPNHLYGCSFGAPMEYLLKVNGQDEIFDSLAYEDCALGCCLSNVGARLFYNRNALTLESHELHFQGTPLKREDPGKSPMDASHSLYYGTEKYPAPSGFKFPGVIIQDKGAPNPAYMRAIGNRFDLAALRKSILSGGEFPIPTEPKLRWYDSKSLSEM